MHPTRSDLKFLARRAGEILFDGFGQEHQIGYKGLLDLVTEVDHRSEDFLVQAIRERFPADQIVTEESGNLAGRRPTAGSSTRWTGRSTTPTACRSSVFLSDTQTARGCGWARYLTRCMPSASARSAGRAPG